MSLHRLFALSVTVVAVAVACVTIGTLQPASSSVRPPKPLRGGADSVEVLIDRMVAALSANDDQALERLRVTEEEYRDIIVPGTIEKGQPPRTVDEKTFNYFWGVLDKKSRLFGQMLLNRFAGDHYTRTEFHFSRAPLSYDWYNAYGSLRVTLKDDEGDTRQLETGWVSEVGGKYKFIGFQSQ